VSKVLLVEDDNNLREIYEARLAAEGYEIVTAQNGEEALVVAKQNKPDLIISDVMMPRISGFEMLDILRNTDELKDTKVIMLTALGQSEDQDRAGKLGADKYLVKSQVTLEDIVNSAKELLGEGGAAPAATAPAQQAAAPVDTPAPAAPQTPATPTPMPVAEPPADPVATPAPDANAPAADPAPAPDTSAPAEPAAVAPETPAPAPEPAAAPASDVATTAAQSTATEEATVKDQIADFANNTAAAPAPTTPEVAQPAPATPDVAPVSVSAENDKMLSDAVNQLNEATNKPEEPALPPSQQAPAEPATPETPAPAPEETPTPVPTPEAAAPTGGAATEDDVSDNPQAVAGRKVIQPISAPDAKPSLDELLAKEAAKEQAANGAAAPVVGTDTPPQLSQTQAPAPNTSGVDPNSIAL